MGDPKKFEVGATPDGVGDWSSIDWTSTHKAVERLQARIAKAAREKRWGKVRSLQRILVRSLPARRLAVRRVTMNKGKRTPGIDRVLWNVRPRRTPPRQRDLNLKAQSERQRDRSRPFNGA